VQEFPSKQNPAHKNVELVERVKQLWERNTSQREMLRILNEEDGFDIKERELMRVRAKNRWLLRVPNGMKAKKRDSEVDVMDQLQQALFEEGQQGEVAGAEDTDKGIRLVVPLSSMQPPFVIDEILLIALPRISAQRS
jgi:hypothetical protein